MTDFRSDPMPSAEGRGLARQAWDAYSRGVNRVAAPAVRWFSGLMTADLVGFWVMWHLEGGFEGLQRVGMSRASIFRRIKTFRRITGQHPDEFSFPGVTLDLKTYLESPGVKIAPAATHPARSRSSETGDVESQM